MSEDNKQKKEESLVDLSQLADLEFKTAWSPSSAPAERTFKRHSFDGERHFEGRKDRDNFKKRREFKRPEGGAERKPRTFAKDGEKRDFSDKPRFERRPDDRQRRFSKDKKHFAPFKFSLEVLFYPEDSTFAKLSSVMKRLKRTYQLFDIAQLILEKPERFIVVLKNLPDADGKVQPFYCAQPQNLPFSDESSAKRIAVEHYLSELFTKEIVEVEAPKGNFQVVNKCNLGGELLGAPNWHRYNEFLREFHSEKYPNMSFEKFLTTIESSRNADEISAWMESMKKREVYKLINPGEGEENTFETKDQASNFILRKYADTLVKSYEQVRMRGSNITLLPNGPIKRNIEEALKMQRKFPILTANNLRGRLRRSHFAIYKKGAKSHAFVSSVKRKFLFEGETLAEFPQKILDFITANPNISAYSMPYAYLGLTVPQKISEPKTLSEEHKHAPDVHVEAPQDLHAQELDIAENPEPELDVAAPVSEKISADSVELHGEIVSYSDDEIKKIKEIAAELLWLIAEGYVVEYADASLLANAYLPKPKLVKKEASVTTPEAVVESPEINSETENLTEEKSTPAAESATEEKSAPETAENAGA